LTTASDERSENGPFSAVGSASAPPRIVKTRAVARASGVNNPLLQGASLRSSGPPLWLKMGQEEIDARKRDADRRYR
jgi:hypothetical protein